ncbi:hypothetical protein AB0P36_29740 [Streptomyces flavidovirens]|uniref:hypothetical protein n=1 Tax=Streptomyces flavidovirens TaxID=67298 RepID=UPI003431CB90
MTRTEHTDRTEHLDRTDRTDPGGLDALFDPRSVAVVGASDNPEKWGYWLASGALEGRDRRRSTW